MASLKERWPVSALLGEQIISERKGITYTLYNNNNLMAEISNFRDKYLKEYRVKNTNISILIKSKIASHSYPDIKHLHLTLKANLTQEKQPRAQHEHFT